MLLNNTYVLRGKNVVPFVGTIQDWAREFEKTNRRVASTEIGEVHISTVFLCIDHNFGSEGPPLVFETMIFNGKLDQYQRRCSTWEEAEREHSIATMLVLEGEENVFKRTYYRCRLGIVKLCLNARLEQERLGRNLLRSWRAMEMRLTQLKEKVWKKK